MDTRRFRSASRGEVLEQAIEAALHEIGVPGEGCPANIANAYKILEDALTQPITGSEIALAGADEKVAR